MNDWHAAAAAWWASPAWLAYEKAYGDAPGTRSRLLATATWRTRILDLTPDESTLWRGVRKSYHAIINKANRFLEFEPASDMTDLAMRLHAEAADRMTRSRATWDLMHEWSGAGHGFLIIAYERGTGEALAFAYFIVNDGWAYYASGAALIDNVQHAVIWQAILELKARGIVTLELGWQGHAADAKGQGIETFKRGFGGVDVPVSAAEKVFG